MSAERQMFCLVGHGSVARATIVRWFDIMGSGRIRKWKRSDVNGYGLQLAGLLASLCLSGSCVACIERSVLSHAAHVFASSLISISTCNSLAASLAEPFFLE